MRVYSLEIVEILKAFFAEDDWHYEFDPERGCFTGGIKIESKLDSVRFVIFVQDGYMRTYLQLKIAADENVRSEVAEFITRANYCMNFGGFEMDFNDGELRYRTTTTLPDLRDDAKKAIAYALLLPCKTVERYADGLLSVLFGFSNAEDAIQKAESAP